MHTIQRIAITLFALWLCSGFLGLVLGLDKEEFSKQEMRKPGMIQELTMYKTSKAFLGDVEKFWDDRIFLRKYYISLYQFLQLENLTAAFRSSGSHVTGEDDWIFLGNSYSQVIEYTKNAEALPQIYVDFKLERVKKLQNIATSQNIPFVMVIAPNKHSIYGEFLPYWIKPKSDVRFADAVFEKAPEQGVFLSFAKKALLQEKKLADAQGKRLYSKDDTHWNAYGAFHAFKEAWAMLRLQGDLPNIVPAISIEQVDKTHNGDLIAIGKYSDSYRDVVGYRCVLDAQAEKNIQKKKQLLVIGDSFTWEFMPLYNFAFEKITRLHWNEVNTAKFAELIKELKPDAVVYQVVERHFLYDGIAE